jgi:hypothetical protein
MLSGLVSKFSHCLAKYHSLEWQKWANFMGHVLTNVFESTKAVTIFSDLKEKTGEYKYLSDSFDLFRIAKASL